MRMFLILGITASMASAVAEQKAIKLEKDCLKQQRHYQELLIESDKEMSRDFADRWREAFTDEAARAALVRYCSAPANVQAANNLRATIKKLNESKPVVLQRNGQVYEPVLRSLQDGFMAFSFMQPVSGDTYFASTPEGIQMAVVRCRDGKYKVGKREGTANPLCVDTRVQVDLCGRRPFKVSRKLRQNGQDVVAVKDPEVGWLHLDSRCQKQIAGANRAVPALNYLNEQFLKRVSAVDLDRLPSSEMNRIRIAIPLRDIGADAVCAPPRRCSESLTAY